MSEVARRLRKLAGRKGGSGRRYDAIMVSRYEEGAAQVAAEVADEIERVSDGKVTVSDLHAARLAWLKTHKHAAEAKA